MRYAIPISRAFLPFFRLTGFNPAKSFVELDDDSVRVRFGTADETIPISNISGVEDAKWPIYFGLGAKLTPKSGVGYVGTRQGVVTLHLNEPVELNVWGPFKREQAKSVTVSVQNAEGFKEELQSRLHVPAPTTR